MLTLHLCQPLGLPVMLGGAGDRVEEHQQKHQPVEVGGLDGHAAVLPHGVIELTQLVTKRGQKQMSVHLRTEKQRERERWLTRSCWPSSSPCRREKKGMTHQQ